MLASSRDANAGGLLSASENSTHLSIREALPVRQLQQLALVGLHLAQCPHQLLQMLLVVSLRVELALSFECQSHLESHRPLMTAQHIDQYSARNAVEPEQFLIARRNVVEASPSNDERFGDKIFSIAAVIETTKCVAQEGVTVRSNHSRELRILFAHLWPSLSHYHLNVRTTSIPSLDVRSLDLATADGASTQRKDCQRTTN